MGERGWLGKRGRGELLGAAGPLPQIFKLGLGDTPRAEIPGGGREKGGGRP